MNNFNEGDKILCKKDLIANGSTHFIKGKYYVFHLIISDVFDGFECFSFDETNDIYAYFLTKQEFLDCFYMKNEVRNMKLKKLENYEHF